METWLKSLDAVEAAAVLTVVECIGDTAAKLDTLPLTLASYNALAYLLTKVLPQNNLAIVNGYWVSQTNFNLIHLGLHAQCSFRTPQHVH